MFVTTIETPDGPIRCHLSTVAPRRVVPAAERHKWSRIPQRGQTARCLHCGCVKCYRLDYETVYRLAGATEILTERPACTGKPSPQTPIGPQIK